MSTTQGLISERTSIGLAPEVTQGTPVLATTFIPVKSIDITKKPNVILVEAAAQSAAGNRYAVPGIFDYSGPIVVPLFPATGLQLLFAAIGTDGVTGAGPYVHTAVARTIAQLKPFTIEQNVGGNNLDHQWAGGIVGKANVKFAVNAEAEATYNMNFVKDAVLASATASSWGTDVPFSPTSLALSLGGAVDLTCSALDVEIDNTPKSYPTFNATQFPQSVVGTSRKVKYTVTVIFTALNGGAAAAGYFADLAASGGLTVLDAVSATATQGAASMVFGSTKCALTSYKEVMKIGDLIMSELEFTAIADSAASFVDMSLIVTNTQSAAYTS